VSRRLARADWPLCTCGRMAVVWMAMDKAKETSLYRCALCAPGAVAAALHEDDWVTTWDVMGLVGA